MKYKQIEKLNEEEWQIICAAIDRAVVPMPLVESAASLKDKIINALDVSTKPEGCNDAE